MFSPFPTVKYRFGIHLITIYTALIGGSLSYATSLTQSQLVDDIDDLAQTPLVSEPALPNPVRGKKFVNVHV